MPTALLRVLPAALLPVTVCLLLAGCAVPLGPGYSIERQEVQLTYAPDAPDRVRVRAAYRLRNTGSGDLDELDIGLPASLAGEQTRVRVVVEGRDVTSQRKEPRPGEDAAVVTVPFAPPWPRNRRLALVLEYDLEAPGHAGGPLDAFFFASKDWFPALRAPQAFLARGAERGDKVDMRLRVPEGWRALSSGRQRGSRRRDALREFRFEVKEDDFAPYIVAGSYHEQRFTSAGRTVAYWTLKPQASFQNDANISLQALATVEGFFGPRRDPQRPVWNVEAVTTDLSLVPFPPAPAMDVAIFPDGWLAARESLSPTPDPAPHPPTKGKTDIWTWLIKAFGQALAGLGPFLERVIFAFLWVSHDARPTEDSSYLDVVLAGYAAHATGPDSANQRTKVIQNLLEGFAQTTGSVTADVADEGVHPDENREADRVMVRGMLFLYALEDRIGKENVQRGLRRVIQGMRGSTYGWHEIRSALEFESGQDLAEMFRVWLGQPDIPEEFCRKYAPGSDQ